MNKVKNWGEHIDSEPTVTKPKKYDDKPKQYEHDYLCIRHSFRATDLIKKLDDNWEILRVDNVQDGLLYILRREVKE